MKCSIEGCDSAAWCKGFCNKHYCEQRARRLGVKQQEAKTCTVADCGKPNYSHGLCTQHAAEKRRRDKGIQPNTWMRNTTRKPCSVPGCGRLNKARGLCPLHYQLLRARETGRPAWHPRALCTIEGCGKTQHAKGFCDDHYQLFRRNGDPRLRKRINGTGSIDRWGYKHVSVNGKQMPEHRHVMEQKIGRKLLKAETVHHMNGDKLDNRIENLELWSGSQPYGQRVEDKVSWAVELLKLYAPERLAAV